MRFRTVAVCVLVLSALALGIGSGVHPAGAAAASTARVYAANCDTVGYLEYKPKMWGLGCTSGSAEVASAHWTRWTSTQARAVGTTYVENCLPDCAQPTRHATYPSAVVLSKPVRCTSGARVSYFSRATWTVTYPRGNPFGERPGTHTSTFPVANNATSGTRCARE